MLLVVVFWCDLGLKRKGDDAADAPGLWCFGASDAAWWSFCVT